MEHIAFWDTVFPHIYAVVIRCLSILSVKKIHILNAAIIRIVYSEGSYYNGSCKLVDQMSLAFRALV